VIDYSKCHTDAPVGKPVDIPSDNVHYYFKKPYTYDGNSAQWSRIDVNQTYYNGSTLGASVKAVQCQLTFPIHHDMEPPILFYYKLTNFYQNHRRYAKSFDSDQLSGKAVSASTIHSGDCTPLTTTTIDGVDKPYYPCGLAPNSVFNDTFSNPILLSATTGDNATYYMKNNSDISWGSDRELYGQTKYNWSEVAVPPNWVERYPNGYSDDYHPDLENDEAFQVWMRLAGLPTFSKLVQRNDTAKLKAGQYQVNINHCKCSLSISKNIAHKGISVQCHRVWRNEIHHHLDSHCHGRKEPIPRYRLYCCRRSLYPSRSPVYRYPSHQATQTWRPHISQLEQ
jgi:hypothetical protein